MQQHPQIIPVNAKITAHRVLILFLEKDGPQTHQALLGGGVWIIEGLNLSQIEAGDYDLICLPLKIVGSDGAPARAIIRKRSATTTQAT